METKKGGRMLKNIKRLRIVCNRCETEIITAIGSTVRSCPVCTEPFDIMSDDNVYIKLERAIKEMANNQRATFEFVCEGED